MYGSFYLSSRLLDYVILLLYLNSLDLYQAENQVFQHTHLFVIVGWGKTGPAHSFPPSLIFRSSIDHFVFRFMLLFHSILTFMKDLYQSENELFNPTRLLVLLHCWVGMSGPAHSFPLQNLQIFLLISYNCSLSVYVTLSLYLNTYEWQIPKRESSFQTKHFICTATLWGGERLGRPILPPPPHPS